MLSGNKKIFIPVLFLLLAALGISYSQDQVPENLGRNINSIFEERSPVISPDGKTLYFNRLSHPGNLFPRRGDQDIWYSEKTKDGWTEAKNIGYPLNNEISNGVMWVSPDGRKLLLWGVYDKWRNHPNGVSMSFKTNDGWSFPQKLEIKNFLNFSTWFQFSMSSDGKKLLMSIQNGGSIGQNDIFVSFLQKDGTWSTPLNLGRNINTRGMEVSPFLAADGKTLYFSTNARPGFGDFDIFRSTRIDDSWKKWSKPENLGSTINTEGMDAYFRIDASAEYAYFTSDKYSFGASDIFRIKLPEKARPDPVALLSGKVLDAETKSPVRSLLVFLDSKNKETERTNSSLDSGSYKTVLPLGKNYYVKIEADDYFQMTDTLKFKNMQKYTELKKDYMLIPKKESGETLSAYEEKMIYFEFNEYDLEESAVNVLDSVAAEMKKASGAQIVIAGHADEIGTSEYNMELSRKRAESVKQYLVSKGIDAGRIKTKAFGESRPLVEFKSGRGRKPNRRVEISFIID